MLPRWPLSCPLRSALTAFSAIHLITGPEMRRQQSPKRRSVSDRTTDFRALLSIPVHSRVPTRSSDVKGIFNGFHLTELRIRNMPQQLFCNRTTRHGRVGRRTYSRSRSRSSPRHFMAKTVVNRCSQTDGSQAITRSSGGALSATRLMSTFACFLSCFPTRPLPLHEIHDKVRGMENLFAGSCKLHQMLQANQRRSIHSLILALAMQARGMPSRVGSYLSLLSSLPLPPSWMWPFGFARVIL